MLIRSKTTVGSRLVIHTAGLQFDVLTIGICQQILPDTTFTGQAPKENLHPQFLIIIRMMDRSEIIIVPVSAIEVIVFAQYMIRLRVSEIILFIPGNIASLFVERERMEFAAMADIVRAGITELCISGRPITGIHPLVIRLIDGRSVMPGCRCSKRHDFRLSLPTFPACNGSGKHRAAFPYRTGNGIYLSS